MITLKTQRGQIQQTFKITLKEAVKDTKGPINGLPNDLNRLSLTRWPLLKDPLGLFTERNSTIPNLVFSTGLE